MQSGIKVKASGHWRSGVLLCQWETDSRLRKDYVREFRKITMCGISESSRQRENERDGPPWSFQHGRICHLHEVTPGGCMAGQWPAARLHEPAVPGRVRAEGAVRYLTSFSWLRGSPDCFRLAIRSGVMGWDGMALAAISQAIGPDKSQQRKGSDERSASKTSEA